jgi:preprotein translocase subunit SecD
MCVDSHECALWWWVDPSGSRQGQTLRITLDDQILVNATVRGTLSSRGRIPIRKQLRELLLIATVMRSGVGLTRLPTPPVPLVRCPVSNAS